MGDEADEFYRDPMSWLESHYPAQGLPESNYPAQGLPESHYPAQGLASFHQPTIVLFDVLQASVQTFLDARGYVKCSSHFHANFAEGRVGQEVRAFCPPVKRTMLY